MYVSTPLTIDEVRHHVANEGLEYGIGHKEIADATLADKWKKCLVLMNEIEHIPRGGEENE